MGRGGAGLVEIKGASIYRVDERRGEGSVGSDGMNGRMRRFGKRIELMGCLVSRRKTRESREALLKEGRKEVYSSSPHNLIFSCKIRHQVCKCIPSIKTPAPIQLPGWQVSKSLH